MESVDGNYVRINRVDRKYYPTSLYLSTVGLDIQHGGHVVLPVDVVVDNVPITVGGSIAGVDNLRLGIGATLNLQVRPVLCNNRLSCVR